MYLLDTHTLLWFFMGDPRLNENARQLICDENQRIFVSIASLWEISIKHSLRKLELYDSFENLFPHLLIQNDFELLEIKIEHLSTLSYLAFAHRDPFDRIIISQAISEDMTLISSDHIFESYPVNLFR